jgi:hypothetical protein
VNSISAEAAACEVTADGVATGERQLITMYPNATAPAALSNTIPIEFRINFVPEETRADNFGLQALRILRRLKIAVAAKAA